MNEEMFAELVASVREGADILKGDRAPSRSFKVDKNDIITLRESKNLSQSNFARALGISIDTLQNWEQGRRKPMGAAQRLLQLAKEYPQIVFGDR